MAYKLEDIHKSFTEAIVLVDQAMESMNNSIAQMRLAKRRLDSVFEDLTVIMGEMESFETNYGMSSATEGSLPGGLSFRGLGSGIESFADFFKFGGLF